MSDNTDQSTNDYHATENMEISNNKNITANDNYIQDDLTNTEMEKDESNTNYDKKPTTSH